MPNLGKLGMIFLDGNGLCNVKKKSQSDIATT